MRCVVGNAGRALFRLCRAQAHSARRLCAAGLGDFVNDPAAALDPDCRPRLPRGVRLVHSEAQGGWVLLAPERVFKADTIAVEIVKRCTGEATLGSIVDDLAKTFAAPRERILADVTTMLRGLAEKRLLEL